MSTTKEKKADFIELVHQAARATAHGTETRDQAAVLWAAAEMQRGTASMRAATEALVEVEARIAGLEK